jgi:hypothetical protein
VTCGLRISDIPTSDNRTPQETTNQDTPDMGADGARLSCPGSSVVAEGTNGEVLLVIALLSLITYRMLGEFDKAEIATVRWLLSWRTTPVEHPHEI